jgi:hypothetical protein
MERPSIVAVAIFAAVALTGTSALAQKTVPPTPEPQAQSQAPQKTKVWTNDNIDSLRTPADDYEIQEAQKRQAQQAAAAKAAAESKAQAAAALGPAPKSVKQADSMIASKKRDLAEQQQYLQRVRKDASNPNNSSLDQLRLNWRLKSHTISAEQTAAQLKQLEKDKAALAKKEANASTNSGNGSDSAQQ